MSTPSGAHRTQRRPPGCGRGGSDDLDGGTARPVGAASVVMVLVLVTPPGWEIFDWYDS
ncbi:hypothetical protein ACFY36_09435 [Actinoplanes sp. NPDC000266]